MRQYQRDQDGSTQAGGHTFRQEQAAPSFSTAPGDVAQGHTTNLRSLIRQLSMAQRQGTNPQTHQDRYIDPRQNTYARTTGFDARMVEKHNDNVRAASTQKWPAVPDLLDANLTDKQDALRLSESHITHREGNLERINDVVSSHSYVHPSPSHPIHRQQSRYVEGNRGHDGPSDSQYTADLSSTPDTYLERLQAENIKLQHRIGVLELDLRQERQKSEQIRDSANQMQRLMDRKDIRFGQQATDDEIWTRFQKLFADIKSWSTKFDMPNVPVLSQLNAITQVELETIAPACLTRDRDLWQKGRCQRGALIRGWVTLVLVNNVFRSVAGERSVITPPVDVTAYDRWLTEGLQGSVATIEMRLANSDLENVSMLDLHNWRAHTMDLLSRADGDSSTSDYNIHHFVQYLASYIMQFLASLAHQSNVSNISTRLSQIIHDAVVLSALLRRQRACWLVKIATASNHRTSGRPLSIAFDPESMRDDAQDSDSDSDANNHTDVNIHPQGFRSAVTKIKKRKQKQKQKQVKVFIKPGLWKRGNADGEKYESNTCVSPMLVLCKD